MPLVDSMAGHLASSKNGAFRQKTRERFLHFVRFLQDNGLTERIFLQADEYPQDELAIRYEDLTEDGVRVVKAAYNKWLQCIDRGQPPSDTSILHDALAKLKSDR